MSNEKNSGTRSGRKEHYSSASASASESPSSIDLMKSEILDNVEEEQQQPLQVSKDSNENPSVSHNEACADIKSEDQEPTMMIDENRNAEDAANQKSPTLPSADSVAMNTSEGENDKIEEESKKTPAEEPGRSGVETANKISPSFLITKEELASELVDNDGIKISEGHKPVSVLDNTSTLGRRESKDDSCCIDHTIVKTNSFERDNEKSDPIEVEAMVAKEKNDCHIQTASEKKDPMGVECMEAKETDVHSINACKGPTVENAKGDGIEEKKAMHPSPTRSQEESIGGKLKSTEISDKKVLCAQSESNKRNDSADETGEILVESLNGDNDDEEEDDDDWTSSLDEVLEELQCIKHSKSGSTCVGGSAANILPSAPGLEIKGIGHVPLPAMDFTADKIKQVAQQAPHGRGMETIVDLSVRNTLQVDASNVTISNPAWYTGLRQIVSKVADGLGVGSSMVRAELYKLLLYEPGGFFKKHRDTEKADGMFATLVIQLPSVFTGASFIVSHDNESRTFELDKDGSAYECSYVAHYADCEHEIKPILSGYRLALIYSLCYIGNIDSKPHARDLGTCKQLRMHMNHLDPHDSLFCLPLEHQYTSSSLARLGAGALKGADRSQYEAIVDAGEEKKWKCVIIMLERCDHEYGYGSGYYGGFECEDKEEGSPCFGEMYNEDGSDAACHKNWISRQLDLNSLDAGGMILLESEDDMEDFWGDGEEGEVEYTGNEGANRETTYRTYALVFYSEETSFERMCKSDISHAVSEVICNNALWPRLMKYLKEHHWMSTLSLSTKECSQLLSLHRVKNMHRKELAETLHTILSRHRSEIPSSELTELLVCFIKQYRGDEWNETTEPIRSLLFDRIGKACTGLNPVVLLERISFFLRIAEVIKDEAISSVITKSIETFEKETESVHVNPSSFYYRYPYSSNRASQSSAKSVADKIAAMCEQHSWEVIKPAALASFARLKKECGELTPRKLVERASALQTIYQKVPDCDVSTLYQEIIEEFVVTLEKYGARDSYSSQYIFSVPLVTGLLMFGSQSHIQRIDRWGSTADLNQVSKLIDLMSMISDSKLQGVKTSCIKALKAHQKQNKIQSLKAALDKLLGATKDGAPIFSWSMPLARTYSPQLSAFLHSSQPGPKVIVVGGGVKHSRSLQRNSGADLSNGYSANIVATCDIGKRAAIRVTKTKALYEEKLRQYRANIKKLKEIQDELHSLGDGIVAVASTATSSSLSSNSNQNGARPRSAAATADVDLTGASVSCQPSPRKKPRTKTPMPKDVEVIELE